MVTTLAPRLAVSHTQIDSAANDETGCIRRWWFKWVHKLPEPIRDTQNFGTIGHAIVERWLGADDLGRDAEGKPVELYPKGWELDEQGHALSEADQDLLRRLIDASIEKGVLRRSPSRAVEASFEMPLREDPYRVDVIGRIDLAAPGEVTDHKFLKSLDYLPSGKPGTKKYLGDSGQHLLYVLAWAEEIRKNKGVVPTTWTLGVNGFSKDPDDFRVKRVEVKVPFERAEQWQREVLEPTVDKMLALRFAQPGIPVENWRDLPDPENKNAACGAYGGCPMAGICSGTETVKGYVHRVKKYNEKKATGKVPVGLVPTETTRGDPEMKPESLFKKLASSTPAPVQSIEPTAAKVPVAAASAPKEQLDAEADSSPPWVYPNCTACKGSGFNTKGNPCRICSGLAEKERGVKTSEFTIQALGDGQIVWAANDGSADGSVRIPGAPQGEATVKEVAPPPVVPTKTGQEPAPASVVPTETGQEDDDEPEAPTNGKPRGKAGRPKQGLTLYVNCTPTKGHKLPVTYLVDIMHQYGEKAAIESNACPAGTEGAFYYMDAFKRRDFLSSRAATIARDLGSCNLVCIRGPDEDRLIAALSAVADVKVVEALR